MCIFAFALTAVCTKQVSWALVHVGLYILQVFLTSPSSDLSATQSLQGVHMRSRIFIRVWGRGWGCSTNLCRAFVAWRGGLLLTVGEIEGLSCVFSIFDAGGSARRCTCAYMQTHTHCTCHRALDVSPGIGTRHLEGPENPDGQNVGKHVFVYVYKVHMCIYMLGGGMRSGLTAFFFNMKFLPKKQSKRCNHKTENSNQLEIWIRAV